VNDTQLADQLATDLSRAFERCMETYQPRVYAFALRLTAQPQDAEEIAQDTFVRAYRALAGYAPERIRTLRLRPWLFQIALNIARNRLRSHRAREASLDDGDEALANWFSVPDSEQPEAIAERSERQRELAGRVRALPEHFRIAVLLRFVADLSYMEISELLGKPEGTVKAHVHRGIVMLRESLVRVPDEVR